MIEVLDQLADTFRFWASGGAFYAFPLAAAATAILASAAIRRTRVPFYEPMQRACFKGSITLAMLGFALAGLIIPLANDGRLADFTRESVQYKAAIAAVWFMWGASAWLVVCGFARQFLVPLLSSACWLIVCFVAMRQTLGAAL